MLWFVYIFDFVVMVVVVVLVVVVLTDLLHRERHCFCTQGHTECNVSAYVTGHHRRPEQNFEQNIEQRIEQNAKH